jgi:hypothetical protein
MRKPPSFSSYRSPKNVETIHFMFQGRFGVLQMGLKDGLRSTLADFFIKEESASI